MCQPYLNESYAELWTMWLLGIPLFFYCVSKLLYYVNTNRTQKGTYEADILSYETVCYVVLSYLAYWGWAFWFDWPDTGEITKLNKDRSLSSEFVHQYILIPMACFQLYNFIASVYISEFRGWISCGHHLLTMVVSFMFMYTGYHYYAVFVLGCTELSSVPLVIIEVFKRIQRFRVMFPHVYNVSKIVFAISFIIIRNVWLPIISCQLICEFNVFAPVGIFVKCQYAVNIVVCLIMNGLQLYWGMTIILILNKGHA